MLYALLHEGLIMYHSFEIDLACQFGILEAVILNNMEFWIAKNEANEKNFYDGFTWTYNSARALNELFPYVSQRQIRNALKHLQDEGIIQTGNYNRDARDRTLWYAFTEKGNCILQKSDMQNAKTGHAIRNFVQPLPDNKTTDNKTTDNNKAFRPPTVAQVTAYCLERGNKVDAEHFVDYYQRQNWKLSNGQKMSDWKAAVRTWERTSKAQDKKPEYATHGEISPMMAEAAKRLLEEEQR